MEFFRKFIRFARVTRPNGDLATVYCRCSSSGTICCFKVAVTIIAKLTKRAAFPNPQAKVEERASINFMTSITIEVAANASCRLG